MTAHAMFFVQPCPTCGRRLRVCVEYLGKTIQCRHCRGRFVARDPDGVPLGANPERDLMERVDELLASTGDARGAKTSPDVSQVTR
jgi:hypothetical protein